MSTVRHLVIYDVSDDDLREWLADLLGDMGLRRIQWSVFEGDLTPEELRRLLAEVSAHRPDEGRFEVRLQPLCALCAERAESLGHVSDTNPAPEIVIF